ncbi:MAG: YDG domain-containing protein, partial [Thermoproteota archaeon]|nr:YDG domain-containing protein [Thermoproteota archaeon]
NTLALGGATFNYNSTSSGDRNLFLGGDVSYSGTAPAVFVNTNTGIGEFRLGSGVTRNLNISSASLSQPEVQIGWSVSQGASAAALTKTGNGALLLSGAIGYTGTTTITDGELRLNPSTNITPGTQFILNGGKLSTTGIAAGRTIISSSTLRLDAASSIDLDPNADHTLKFAASNAVTWNGAGLTINNWVGTAGSSGTKGKIFFGASATALTSTQLAKISFIGVSGTPILLNTGELVPPASNSITTGAISGSPFCAGAANVNIPFTYSPTAAFSGATFTAQLSDASGSFAAPVNLQSIASDGSGSQSISITVPPGTASGMEYRIRVISNTPALNGSANASNLTINALPADKIVTAASPSVCSGSGTNIMIAASQAGVNYQLRNNADNSLIGNAVAGNEGTINLPTGNLTATTIFNVLATDATTSCNLQMTNTVTVTVNARPIASFIAAPGANTCTGTDITYTTQSEQSDYVWSVSGTPGVDYSITSGSTTTESNTVTLKWVTTDSKTVTVNYTDANGCSSVNPASSITTIDSGPSFTIQPTAQSITYGANASFTVEASGTPTITYKWEISKNSGASWSDVSAETFTGYSGATSNTLSITKPTVVMSGYQYRAVVTNGCGNITSGLSPALPALLTVDAKALSLTGAAAQNKVYDGTTAAVVTGTLSGVLSGETVGFSGTGSFAQSAVGTDIAVSSTSSLTGAAAANYTLTQPVGLKADITARLITVTPNAGQSKL